MISSHVHSTRLCHLSGAKKALLYRKSIGRVKWAIGFCGRYLKIDFGKQALLLIARFVIVYPYTPLRIVVRKEILTGFKTCVTPE